MYNTNDAPLIIYKAFVYAIAFSCMGFFKVKCNHAWRHTHTGTHTQTHFYLKKSTSMCIIYTHAGKHTRSHPPHEWTCPLVDPEFQFPVIGANASLTMSHTHTNTHTHTHTDAWVTPTLTYNYTPILHKQGGNRGNINLSRDVVLISTAQTVTYICDEPINQLCNTKYQVGTWLLSNDKYQWGMLSTLWYSGGSSCTTIT